MTNLRMSIIFSSFFDLSSVYLTNQRMNFLFLDLPRQIIKCLGKVHNLLLVINYEK
jgi:hypothetical protein